MRAGFIITLSLACISYMLTAASWLVEVVGFGLQTSGVAGSYANVQHLPVWALVVGSPLAIIIIGIHVIVLCLRVKKKMFWCCFSIPLAFTFAYIFVFAGITVYLDGNRLASFNYLDENVHLILRVSGSAGIIFFTLLSLACLLAATPFVFEEEHVNRISDVVADDFVPMVASTPKALQPNDSPDTNEGVIIPNPTAPPYNYEDMPESEGKADTQPSSQEQVENASNGHAAKDNNSEPSGE